MPGMLSQVYQEVRGDKLSQYDSCCIHKVLASKDPLNGTTRYLCSGASHCLEELGSGDDIVARYTYEPGYVDAVAVREGDIDSRSADTAIKTSTEPCLSGSSSA